MSANQAWIDSISEVERYGHWVSPRGFKSKEMICHYSAFDMNSPICVHPDRGLNYSFMAAEAYWITSGSMFVEDITPYNRHIAQFSDDKYIFNGAYGPRFVHQFEHVVNTLVNDSTSRQAVMTIWTPNPMKTKDYPCTLNLQWLIRRGQLHCVVNMRSNDLWLGRPYDFFNFTIMSLRILCDLNQRTDNDYVLGDLQIQVGSLHYYEQDEDKIIRLLENSPPDVSPSIVPERCYRDWPFVVDSLLACRDKEEYLKDDIWRIRPL